MFLLKQEIGKAKTERKKEQAKASMKSFSTIVKYCEEAKCRHRVFRYVYNCREFTINQIFSWPDW